MYVGSYLLPVKGTISDFQHMNMSESIPTSLSVLPDSKNMGIKFGIPLLSVYKVRYGYFRLEPVTLDFTLSVRSCNVFEYPIGLLNLKT
jgi:hypothetical protein